jgi:hypothetical protein
MRARCTGVVRLAAAVLASGVMAAGCGTGTPPTRPSAPLPQAARSAGAGPSPTAPAAAPAPWDDPATGTAPRRWQPAPTRRCCPAP